MDREFFIHIDWLPRPPHIFGNVWPVQDKEDEDDEASSVAMKSKYHQELLLYIVSYYQLYKL